MGGNESEAWSGVGLCLSEDKSQRDLWQEAAKHARATAFQSEATHRGQSAI